jgi:hypothetical protein
MVAGSMIQLTADLGGLNKSAGSIFNLDCFIGFGLDSIGSTGSQEFTNSWSI